ncbi:MULTISPECIES: flagellar biosynthesis protein FlhF [unclassified Halomonas]|uniref:flagellar biosynthesis protein FlhF n=1 Tax=unclassified Halomonas TaxID=2609666 RepID=UPI002884E44B|nr:MULTISPECIES: flagellar biosynthesis protein FlhF [unclassified Halomonas]MDT0500547.1 flagellar biosynthesis protein FlhF [Halomonas sp. PAR7]MDT0511557.1 flagellar biosynthesis protein FlhF [Halomonas sp. LES1]MDT0590155.1 flagellar biosynthesis protein FlhF [Halomonas sp. PAR8]
MGVMRFTGVNSREAMRQVREALGDDALILANRPTDNGVEILAMADDAVNHLAASPAPAPATPAVEPLARGDRHEPPESGSSASHPATSGREAPDLQAMSERLLSEMQDMRALLAREQARRHPETDCAGRLRRILCEAGFSPAFTRRVVTGLPRELDRSSPDDERPLAWLQRQLANQLSVAEDGEAFFDPPGITALVGPTGVGKTTTTAKLAARYVERHGAERVALVTTDSFRIGAHEQLRIYAELLGIPMVALDPQQPVDFLAPRLLGRRWVIIDTVGMSQRDQRVVEQIAQLQGGRVTVKMVLLLNAASQPETLDEVVRRYRDAAGSANARIERCLLTKQDEACRLAPALETIIRHGLTLSFVSCGQRVPEDLTLPDASSLAARALSTRSPLSVEPPAPSPGPASSGGQLLGQGRRITLCLTRLRHRLPGFSALESAWDLSAASAERQHEALPALLKPPAHTPPAAGLLWAPRRPARSSDWRLPDMLLDAMGLPRLPVLLQHHQPTDESERLQAAMTRCDDESPLFQLFPTLPSATLREQLERRDIRWLARAQPAARVVHQGEPLALSRLAALAEPDGQLTARLRGKAVKASLSRLPVSLLAKHLSDRAAPHCQAWHMVLHDEESGRLLGKRYWLTSSIRPVETRPLLAALQGESLEPLTRQAMSTLKEWLPPTTRPELTLALAAGIAAVTTHLEHAEDEEAMDLRAELLELQGGRRRRRDTALLQALLQLFATRDAIRQLQTGGGAA